MMALTFWEEQSEAEESKASYKFGENGPVGVTPTGKIPRRKIGTCNFELPDPPNNYIQ